MLSPTEIEEVTDAETALWWSLARNAGSVMGSTTRRRDPERVNIMLPITAERASNGTGRLGCGLKVGSLEFTSASVSEVPN